MSGRIRSLKPEWLEDELLALASLEARVLSVSLLLLADDYGNGRANAVLLVGRVFPGKLPETVEKALGELASIRYLTLYEVDGQRYFSIRNWLKHQRVDKPGKAKVPSPEDASARNSLPNSSPENIREAPENIPEDAGKVPASRASSSSSISIPDPYPKSDQPDRSDQRFAMRPDWKPSADVLASFDVAMIPAWGYEALVALHRTHFCAKKTELRTDEEWNQSCSKWVIRDWNNPAKRPKRPEDDKPDPKAVEESKRKYQDRVDRDRAAQRARDALEAAELGLGTTGDVKTILGAIGNG
jgi:hypothetical protein